MQNKKFVVIKNLGNSFNRRMSYKRTNIDKLKCNIEMSRNKLK